MDRIIKFILFISLVSCNERKEFESHDQEIFYYPNGKVQAIKSYKDSLFDGECFWFYPNGNLEQKITFLDGKKSGYAYFFYESGALANMKLFNNNVPTGYSEDFYDHSIGISKSIAIFNDSGKMIYRKIFDSTGRLIRDEEANFKRDSTH